MMLASVLPFLTWLVAISSSLGPFVQAAEDELSIEVTDVFIVKTGAGGGSCDGHMDKVKDWFKDSLAIASAPITVANNALTVDSSPANLLGMEYLGTYFSIPPPDDEEDSHSRRVLSNYASRNDSINTSGSDNSRRQRRARQRVHERDISSYHGHAMAVLWRRVGSRSVFHAPSVYSSSETNYLTYRTRA